MIGQFLPRFGLALAALVLILAASPGVAAGPITPTPAEAAWMVAEANILDPATGWIRPSPHYSGSWLRDSFWTTGYLGSGMGRRALERFGSRLNAAGQAPTKLDTASGPAYYHDDESTLLYLIWAARDGGQSADRLSRAWGWVRRHVADGGYWTGQGNFHTWYDTLIFPDRDVAAYNQGLYATAAIAATRWGLADAKDADAARDFYRWMVRPDLGYLPISLRLDYHDASALVGELLARSLFGQALLHDATVVATVRALPRSGPGFPVLARRDGSYLDPGQFFLPSAKGRYQNGGSWLLYDVLAWSVASKAGMDEAREMAMKRMRLESVDGTLYEYLPTGPSANNTPLRVNYAWNSYAATALGLGRPVEAPAGR